MDLVTLEEARAHLRIDDIDSNGGPDDFDLALKITAASGAVLNYLKGAPIGQPVRDNSGRIVVDSDGASVYEEDSDGVPVVRFEVKASCLLMLGYFYRHRDGDPEKLFERGYLPAPVTALLYPLRSPALR